MSTKLETFIEATVKHAIELTFNKGLAMTDAHAKEATRRIMEAVDKSYADTKLASKNKGVSTEKKAASSRANGAKGGRPRKVAAIIDRAQHQRARHTASPPIEPAHFPASTTPHADCTKV